MATRTLSRRLLLAVVGLLAASRLAMADIHDVIVYGDSLSDNGNLYALTGSPPSPPYYLGRRSNGPVAVEQVASRLGVPLMDFAWAGATTGMGNYADGGTTTTMGGFSLPGMAVQYNASLPLVAPAAHYGLFVVWGGPNDFLAPSPADTTAAQIVDRAVADLLAIVVGLQGIGAEHILAPGMPDLGLSPYYQSLGGAAAAEASAVTDAFNAKLRANLPANVLYYDTAALMRAAVANPAAYGFTNVSLPCLSAGGAICADPDEYLFWDDFHPTSAMSGYVADGFLTTAVPEPATFWLFGGLIALTGLRRWTRCRR